MRSVPGCGRRKTSARCAVAWLRRSATMSPCPCSFCARRSRAAITGWLWSVLEPTMRMRLGLFEVGKRAGVAADADGAEEALRGGALAVARAVVHVVRPKHGAGELLHEVGLLVRGLARRDEGHAVGPVLVHDGAHPGGDRAEGIVPRGFLEVGIGAHALAHERVAEAVGGVHVVPPELALDARRDAVGGALAGGQHLEDAPLARPHLEAAPDAAVGADGLGLLDRRLAHGRLGIREREDGHIADVRLDGLDDVHGGREHVLR